MKLELLTLSFAMLATGMMAGIFFTWSNAVTPGLGRLSDMAYLSALQSMNRTILNPYFYIVFLAPVVLLPLSTYLNWSTLSTAAPKFLLGASALYILGSFLVTMFGNVPLNELLDQTNLAELDGAAAAELRSTIEWKWNGLNWLRTLSSTGAFGLLLFWVVYR